jgi:ligand-binding sensor domain-containing protein/signal transduction histidine kinase
MQGAAGQHISTGRNRGRGRGRGSWAWALAWGLALSAVGALAWSTQARAQAQATPAPGALGFEALAPHATTLFRPLHHEIRLPESTSAAPLADRRGHLWMTLKGVGAARLEGLRVREFREPLLMPDGRKLPHGSPALAVDAQGEVWAHSRSGVLSRFDARQRRFVPRAQAGASPGLASTQAFVFDTAGNAWLSSVDGVWLVKAEQLQAEGFSQGSRVLAQKGIYRMAALPGGQVAALSDFEIQVFDPASGRWQLRMDSHPKPLIDMAVPLGATQAADRRGSGPTPPPEFWVLQSQADGSARVQGWRGGAAQGEAMHQAIAPGDEVSTVIAHRQHEWVMGSTHGQLWWTPDWRTPGRRITPAAGSVHALPTGALYMGMVSSHEGQIWVNTQEALFVGRPHTPGLIHLQPGTGLDAALQGAHGRMVLRSLGPDALLIVDNSPSQLSFLEWTPQGVRARRVATQPATGLLYGESASRTHRGTWVISGQSASFGLWEFTDIRQGKARRLPGTESLQFLQTLALGEGLVMTSFSREMWWMPTLGQPPIRLDSQTLRGPLPKAGAYLSPVPGASHRFWATGQEGAVEIDLQTRQSRALKLSCLQRGKPCELGEMGELRVDRAGRLWARTNRGIFRAQQAGSGILSPVLRSDGTALVPGGWMVEDEQGAFWVHVQQGLAHITLDARVSEFGRADDLPPSGQSLAKLGDGSLVRAARGAISVIQPQAFRAQGMKAKLSLNALTVDGQARPLAERVYLAPGERKFTLEWSVQDYANPARNALEYRLEGYEKGWTRLDAATPLLSFENLPPGAYTLQLRGFNGRADPLPDWALEVEIAPHWWQTWWFRLLGLAALCSGVWALVRLRTLALVRYRRELQGQVQARTQELARSSEALQAAHTEVSELLSHVKQAIFSVDAQLRVSGHCSQSCQEVFEAPIAGQDVVQLLCPQQGPLAKELRECLSDALNEPQLQRRRLFTSLAPAEFQRGSRVLRPEIVPLAQGFMFIVSDVTQQRELQAHLEREQNRLSFVLGALSDSEEFFDTLQAWEAFAAAGAAAWLPPQASGSQAAGAPGQAASPEGGADWAGLYRQLHTFKGSFAHLGFHHLPQAQHMAEDALRDAGELSEAQRRSRIQQIFEIDWTALLEADLDTLRSVLGDDFLKQRGVVQLQPEQADCVEQLVAQYLQEHPDAPPAIRNLSRLRVLKLKSELQAHDKTLQRLAQRLGKQVMPVQVQGPELALDPSRFRPWLSALVHVFRNALDHGIEAPEQREEAGKPEAGQLRGLIQLTPGPGGEPSHFTLELEDDGAGIQEARLRERAVSQGLLSAQAAQSASLEDLAFAQGLSSREQADTLSGRGVGLAAVRAEVLKLGGQIRLMSRPGQGLTVWMQLPLHSLEDKRGSEPTAP